MEKCNFGPNVIYSPSSCIRWWVGVGGEGLDFCKSKQKQNSTNVTLTKKCQNKNHQKLIVLEGFSTIPLFAASNGRSRQYEGHSGQHFKLSLSILSKGSKPPSPPTLGGNERCLDKLFVHVFVSTCKS